MIDIKKGAIALCLSGLAIGSTAGTALASTASTARATTAAQSTQVAKDWCGYKVIRARNGLYVRSGPNHVYRVVGSLNSGERTTGACAKVRGWVHLSSMYHHYAHVSKKARGWSYGYYLGGTMAANSWCGYQVFRAPQGLFVRTGPGRGYWVIGALRNGQWTTGSCATAHGWVHLSNKFIHYPHVSTNARGWSYGFYLRK